MSKDYLRYLTHDRWEWAMDDALIKCAHKYGLNYQQLAEFILNDEDMPLFRRVALDRRTGGGHNGAVAKLDAGERDSGSDVPLLPARMMVIPSTGHVVPRKFAFGEEADPSVTRSASPPAADAEVAQLTLQSIVDIQREISIRRAADGDKGAVDDGVDAALGGVHSVSERFLVKWAGHDADLNRWYSRDDLKVRGGKTISFP